MKMNRIKGLLLFGLIGLTVSALMLQVFPRDSQSSIQTDGHHNLSISAHFDWNDNGTAICTATGSQSDLALVSDGLDGAIIAWRDEKIDYTTADIHAQRINSEGVVQWEADGVVVCNASSGQYFPCITSDGNNGAILTWLDSRNGNDDIYAQRINSSGAVQWTDNGVAICTALNDQSGIQMVNDGYGGAIITWEDTRSGVNGDIYAQRINATGHAQWVANGSIVCNAPGPQNSPHIAKGVLGSAIITWGDNRSGNYDIYAQRMNPGGTTLFSDNGTLVCNALGHQRSPQIISDGNYGAILIWSDDRSGNYDIYSQRINSSLEFQWDANGTVVCNAIGDIYNYQLISDSAGGAMIVWEDMRNWAVSYVDLYAQRIDGEGTNLWGENGTIVCNEKESESDPQIVTDGVGGAIIAWVDDRMSTEHIYAQRLSSGGNTIWGTNGTLVCNARNDQFEPQLINNAVGSAIIMWVDSRDDDGDIYAQLVVSDRNSSSSAIPGFELSIVITTPALVIIALSITIVRKKGIKKRS